MPRREVPQVSSHHPGTPNPVVGTYAPAEMFPQVEVHPCDFGATMPGPRKKKIRLQPGGPELTGTVMQFQPVVETFNEYLLDDGTVVNMKLVVTEVVRLDDAYDEQGQ